MSFAVSIKMHFVLTVAFCFSGDMKKSATAATVVKGSICLFTILQL